MKKLILIIYFSLFIFHYSFGQQYGWVNIGHNIPGDSLFHNLSDLHFINDNEGWINSNTHNEIYYTSDGGTTFSTRSIASTIDAIHMTDANNGYAAADDGSIFMTTNGGINWNFLAPTFANLDDLTFPLTGSTETGYACGDDGAIFRVSSTGANVMASGVVSNLNSVTFPSAYEGWACGELIIHLSDGSWQKDQTHPTFYFNAIYFTDTVHGWAAGDNGCIAHTTDGQNWTAQTNPDPQGRSLYALFFVNPNEGWAVGVEGVILHSENGGTTWTLEGNGLTKELLTGVQFTSSTNGFITGNNKTFLKYSQISGEEETGRPGDREKVEVWPNPTSGKFQITSTKFQINYKTQIQKIEVADLYGKVIDKIVCDLNFGACLEFGACDLEFDITSCPAGIYFIRIHLENQTIVKKIIKL